MTTPVGDVANDVLTGVLGALNHGALSTVDAAAVYAKFRAGGHPGVAGPADVLALELESVDQVVGSLHVPYIASGLAEGTATGLGGCR